MSITIFENFRALFYAPFYAAYVLGAYREEGIAVTLRHSPDPATTAEALRCGEADVIWGGPLRVLTMYDQNPACELICFCDCVRRDPFFIIGRHPKPTFTLSDLKAVRMATVAEVSPPWLCLQQDLREANIDPVSLSRIHGPSMAENTDAFRRGEIDAVQVFQPHAEDLIASGKGHVWYAAANRGPTAYTTLVTRRSVLKDRADELTAMIRALDRTLRWVDATPGFEIAKILTNFFPLVPYELFAAAVDRYKALSLWAADPIIGREGFTRMHTAMRAGGALSHDIAFETCVDTELARRAAPSVRA
jgi:NitT/TauT family transport system substrate-binding protein